MPQFSVIIPTCNRLALLRQTLESVRGQRGARFEIIVIDDGSTDGTQDYLVSLGTALRGFRLNGQGPGAARNLGAEHARGDYLAFLDDDDMWFPGTLQVYSEVLEKCHQPCFLAGKPWVFREGDQLPGSSARELRWAQFNNYYTSADQWRWWGTSSFVIRRESFTRAGGFCTERINGEDADLALRLGQARGFVQILAPYTFAYREHPGSAKQDPARTLAGMRYMIAAEQAGRYPGGKAHRRQRWRILTRHVRPVTLEYLRKGLMADAWQLYRQTMPWNFAIGRWKYLFGFACMATTRTVTGAFKGC